MMDNILLIRRKMDLCDRVTAAAWLKASTLFARRAYTKAGRYVTLLFCI